MSIVFDMSQLSVVFISYDEVNADENYRQLLDIAPNAARVHGVKGFDAAHRRAGDLSQTAHVITVDGDNIIIDPGFFCRRLNFSAMEMAGVISFSARLAHNALLYGNGGIKIWPRPLLRCLRTHEASHDGKLSVDFCWRVPYVQAAGIPSESVVTATPFQAFRAGLREGARLTTQFGVPAGQAYPDLPPAEALNSHIAASNLERLRIWCSVGRDTVNGVWAIFGARLGCVMAALEQMEIANISDYDWIADFWENKILRYTLDETATNAKMAQLGDRLREELNLEVSDLSAPTSRFVKSIYRPKRRIGTLTVD